MFIITVQQKVNRKLLTIEYQNKLHLFHEESLGYRDYIIILQF